LLTEHDRKWNPAKDKFLPWIEFNLRRHAPIGIRLVKQWKPYKQTEKLEQLLSLSAPVKVPDCDDAPIAELGDLIADICREMEDELSEKDYEELGRAYSLTEIEIFILLIYDEMKEEGASTLAIKKYLNCRLQGRLGHFQSARHLETVIAQLRLKALDFHQQHLYDQ
jgi:hypothetical protein